MPSKDIEILEKNIRESFRLAKTDILRLEQAIDNINQKIHDLEDRHLDNKEKIDKIKNGKSKFYISTKQKNPKQKVKIKIIKVKVKPKKQKKVKKIKKSAKKFKHHKHKFVAAIDGKKFHVLSCVFAKNIKPKKRISFASKTTALNRGLKPCKCVLK